MQPRQSIDVDGLSLENLNRLVLELEVDPSSVRLEAIETSDCNCGVCYTDPRMTLQWDFRYVPDITLEFWSQRPAGFYAPYPQFDPTILDLPEEPIR